MANGCKVQQNAFFAAGDRPVICPKPRRLFSGSAVSVCPFRWTADHPAEASDPKPANDLLDLDFLLPKQMDPTPPFFCGSPPTRSGNPVVHDARFGEAPPLGPVPAGPSWTGSGSARSGFARIRYDVAPAAVRIEGFACLDRERSGSRGIPAVA